MNRTVCAGLGALLISVSAACAQPAPEAQNDQRQTPPEMEAEQIGAAPRVVPQSLEEVKLSFAPVVERAAPAVVNI